MNLSSGDLRIYIVRDDAGQALYVGISGNLGRRLASHLAQPWVGDIARIDVLKVDADADPWTAEQDVIDREQPLYNREVRSRGPRQPGDCHFFRFCGSKATTNRRLGIYPATSRMVSVCESHSTSSDQHEVAS